MPSVNPGPAFSATSNPVGVTFDPLSTQLNANGFTIGKLAAVAIPFIIAPTGTMANNGAITLGTALSTTYANAYINLPANAIQAGSLAGWYFCQMSSTTVGTVFNNAYTTGLPAIPVAPTSFVSTGPGAYTGVTTSVTGPQLPVQANTMGPNGILRITQLSAVPLNTNSKTIGINVGATTVYALTLTGASNYANESITTVWNRGVSNSNISMNSPGTGLGSPVSGTSLTYSSINFAATQNISFTGQLAVATDYFVMEALMIEVFPG